MQEDKNVDLQQEAKDLVLKELEKNGVINYMRAKIKKSILDIINNENDNTKQKLDFDFMTPLHRLNKSKEIILCCQLIKEFLKFYELEYTFPIFENESNVKENVRRESLLKELKLQGKTDDSKPVLYLLLMDKLSRPEGVAAGLDASKGAVGRYDFSNFGTAYNKSNDDSGTVIIPKKQLSPISLGGTNKSLDMNNSNAGSEVDKFSNISIGDVYKRPTEAKNDENSKITSKDFLEEKKTEEEDKKEEKNKKDDENKFSVGGEKNPDNKYDDEFDDNILEDIENKDMKNSQEKKEGESQSMSTSNVNSAAFDSAVKTNNNNFDYVENSENK